MRRVALVLACMAGLYMWAMQVPATAHAGFDKPWRIAGPIDRAKDAVMPDRCPVIGNPIECVDWGSDRDRGTRTHHDHGYDADAYRTHHEDRGRQCDRDRQVYMLHHWEDGPRSCRVYTEDADYHRGMERMDVPMPVQRGMETMVSMLTVAVDSVGRGL